MIHLHVALRLPLQHVSHWLTCVGIRLVDAACIDVQSQRRCGALQSTANHLRALMAAKDGAAT